MTAVRKIWALSALSLALLDAAGSAEAKVAFTGYGDFRLAPHTHNKISGTQDVLNTFSLTKTETESRGALIDSLGIFATTNISEKMQMAFDVNYRDIGANARTIRIQYAYLDYFIQPDFVLEGGKILLPFGYYNKRRFYPFQRPSITGPVFQSGILGLPISDTGVAARKSVELGSFALDADVYGVNGYGGFGTTTSTFRSATLPGALAISGNVSSRNNNDKISLGGRLAGRHASLPNSEIGASYYRGEWDPNGTRLLQLASGHLLGSYAGFEVLGEYLFVRANDDEGMIGSFGHRDWRTDGFFVITSYNHLKAKQMPLVPWARYEHYRSKGHGGGSGAEKLSAWAGGASLQPFENLQLKAEFLNLVYELPVQAKGDIKLDSWGVTLGLTATY